MGEAWADAGEQGLELGSGTRTLSASQCRAWGELTSDEGREVDEPPPHGQPAWPTLACWSGWQGTIRVKAQDSTLLSSGSGESRFVPGTPWVPRKARFPTSLRVDGPQLYVLRVASTATLPLGPRGLEMSCCGAVGKAVSSFLPSPAFLETGGGRNQGYCLIFVFVWALTLFHALGTMGTRPDPGTVLCCAYVSPVLQDSG